MLNTVPIVIDQKNNEETKAYLSQLAAMWGLTTVEQSPLAFGLVLEDSKLALVDFSDRKTGGVVVDFLSGEAQYRRQHGGGKKEPIAKAIGMKGQSSLSVIDATPGLGRDAFVLVGLGCHVTMIERSPIVAALLYDGIRRLSVQSPELAKRMKLCFGNSAEVMANWQKHEIDAIYLDPMFPHRKKSALVKKEMRLFQQLLGPDEDADALLAPAIKLAKKRVVVKRPNAADDLAGVKPNMAITSKKHRFDVYINNQL